MKITARVKFSKIEERVNLVQAFFGKSDFSPKNILRILDDETAFIHLEFEDIPPQMIVQAISQCSIIFMDNLETSNLWDLMTEADTDSNYVPDAELKDNESSDEVHEEPEEDEGISEKVTENFEEVAPDTEEETSSDEHPDVTEVQTEETQTEVVETPSEAVDNNKAIVSSVITREPKPNKKRRYGRQKPTEEDYLDIPELETLAKQSATFSVYTAGIASWLGMDDNDTKYFVDLVTILSKIDKVPYEIVNSDVKNANSSLSYNEYRKVKFGKSITSLLESKGIEATLLPFLITVIKFTNQILDETDRELNDFHSEAKEGSEAEGEKHNTESNVKTPDETAEVLPATENMTEDPKYLKCDAFVQILNSIDKNASSEERANEIMRSMGLEQYSKPLYKSACKIIQAAFSMQEFESIDDVLQVAGIEVGTKDGIKVKADLAKWINDFNKKNHVDRMKIVAFLRELKEILK